MFSGHYRFSSPPRKCAYFPSGLNSAQQCPPPHPLSCTKPFGSQNGVSDFENITSSSDQLKTCGSKNFFLECFYINSVLFNINVHALVGNIHFNYNKDQQPSDTPPTTCTHTQLQKANKKHLETKRVAVTAKSWGPI